jgi:hypothetical protein
MAGLAVAVLVLLWGGYVQGWTWTGFRGNDQLWQWLHLLLLPVAIGTLPLWIQHPEYLSRTRRIGYLAAGAAFAALVMAGYLVPLKWTGLAGNTLWNWLQLTVLPVAVVSARFLSALLHSLRENQKRAIICALLAAAWALTIVGGYTLPSRTCHSSGSGHGGDHSGPGPAPWCLRRHDLQRPLRSHAGDAQARCEHRTPLRRWTPPRTTPGPGRLRPYPNGYP